MDLTDGTALVTGANRGIGRALCEALAARPLKLVLAGVRDPDAFEPIAGRAEVWEEHGREQRTYWKGCQDAGEPFQDDHFFVSTDLVELHQRCEVLDYEPVRGISDHAPLLGTRSSSDVARPCRELDSPVASLRHLA